MIWLMYKATRNIDQFDKKEPVATINIAYTTSYFSKSWVNTIPLRLN